MDIRQAAMMREQMVHRGAVEHYAHAPLEKPRMRFPWGLLIGIIILILAYYFITRLIK